MLGEDDYKTFDDMFFRRFLIVYIYPTMTFQNHTNEGGGGAGWLGVGHKEKKKL